MEIPKQLQNENYRFCKIKNGTKAPEEKCWQSFNNYFYYNEEFKKDRDAYGVVCGIGKLYVIDFDEQQIQEELLIKLPTTFTVKTGGKGLYHLYFTDNSKLPLSYQINNKENKRVLDIQGNGKQVIGANSKHAETKRLYEVVNDIDIVEYPQEELLKLLEDLDFKYNLYGGSGTGINAKLITCKFHDDHNPSMALYQDNGTFYCFGCRAYGFIEALDYRGELKTKKTKHGTFYYIEKDDFNRFMKTIETIEKKIPKITYPKVSLEIYKTKLHQWFYFEDDDVIHIQLAVLIGEKIPGDPLWMFIVAPPGALKTETLRNFKLCDDFFPLSDLTSKTFISGLTLGKDEKRRKIKDLLPQLDRKILIFKDFTTVLEKSSEERQEIFAQLREIYDGSFAKKFGTMDETIRYDARFGFIAGVTPIIDKYWKLTQQLGERFLKVRWNENITKTTIQSRKNEGKEKEMRIELEKYAMGFIINLDLSIVPKFDDELYGDFLDKISEFTAIARTPVSIQDSRGEFYFDYIPIPERPTRLVKQLKKLARCLALVKNKNEVDEEELKIVLRVAKDTVPQDRLSILEAIYKYENTNFNGCSRSDIFKNVKIPENSILRVLEQLKLLDLIEVITLLVDKGSYKEQTYFYKTSDIVKSILGTPPTFTAPSSKRQGESTIEINVQKEEPNPIDQELKRTW